MDPNAETFRTENEGKSATNTLTEDRSVHEGGFSEVYDWRPSVEKTDVMRTMEAIEGEYFCELSRCRELNIFTILLFFLLMNTQV